MKSLNRFFVIGSCFLMMNFSQPANAQTGTAHASVKVEVNNLINQTLQDNPLLSGLTVAASKDGNLVVNMAGGFANVEEQILMQPYHRSRIGSVSKIITTAALLKLTEQKPLFDVYRNLYSEVLTDPDYVKAYMRGVKRHRPIITMAISNDKKVYTFYTNGKFSIGSSSDLDKFSGLNSFTLPTGKTVHDIRAIAISKSNKVYTWYEDKTLSIGIPSDLDYYSYNSNVEVSLPSGKNMHHIIGIAIAKSNDHVYVWYDDGTLSSGTSKDLDKYFASNDFSTPWGRSRYDIRGMGINEKDHVFAWFSSGVVSSGSSGDLDRYKSPYAYSVPFIPNSISEMAQHYADMEIRHLLSHTAGFVRDGDEKAALSMFNLPENGSYYDGDINYKEIHRYILSTRKLLFEPGEDSEYSNHGMGTSGHIISEVSGLPYGRYVNKKIIRPLKLSIVPNFSPREFNSAYHHTNSGNNIVTLDWQVKPDRLARTKAAGGWVSSARDLVRFICALDKNPNQYDILKPETIDLMQTKPFSEEHYALGWKKTTKNRTYKLTHNGSASGGKAFMAKFGPGYTSLNVNIGNINVAVCANTGSVSTSILEDLAGKVARAIGKKNIPEDYDLFQPTEEVTLHGIESGLYQGMFDHFTKLGYEASWIDGYSVGDKVYYNVNWQPASGKTWKSYRGLTAAGYQLAFNNRGALSPVFIDSYTINGQIRYNVIFKEEVGDFIARHGLSYNEHKNVMDEAKAKNLEPVNIAVASVNDQLMYTVLYRKMNYSGWMIKSQVKEADYQQLSNDYKTLGFSPVYINGYKDNGQACFTTIFAKNGGGFLKAKHYMSEDALQTELQNAANAGYSTKMITAFDGASALHRFAGLWRK